MTCRWHGPLYIKNNCHRFAVLTILRQWQKQFVLNLTDSKIIFRSVPTFRYRKPLYCTKNVAVLQISRPRFKTFRRSGWRHCKIGIVLEVDHACPVNLSISWPFILYKQCHSIFPFTQPRRKTLFNAVPIFSKIGNAAELSAKLFWFADIISFYSGY